MPALPYGGRTLVTSPIVQSRITPLPRTTTTVSVPPRIVKPWSTVADDAPASNRTAEVPMLVPSMIGL